MSKKKKKRTGIKIHILLRLTINEFGNQKIQKTRRALRRCYGSELTAVAGDRIGDGERECSGTASAAPPRLQLLVLRFCPVLCLINFLPASLLQL